MKWKLALLATVLGVTIALASFGLLNIHGHGGPMANVTVYAAGIPDSYGNRIFEVNIYQNGSGSWVAVSSIDYVYFTNGTTLSIPATVPTIIEAHVHLNFTLAPDAPTALARTRCYLTISTVVTDSLMIPYGSSYEGLYGKWGCGHWYPDDYVSASDFWTPTTDTTYTVTLRYQAYY